MKRKPDPEAALRARLATLEAEAVTLRFNAAATPKPQPIPQRHGWDVE